MSGAFFVERWSGKRPLDHDASGSAAQGGFKERFVVLVFPDQTTKELDLDAGQGSTLSFRFWIHGIEIDNVGGEFEVGQLLASVRALDLEAFGDGGGLAIHFRSPSRLFQQGCHDGRLFKRENPVAETRQGDGIVAEARGGVDHEARSLAHGSVKGLLRYAGTAFHSSREVHMPDALMASGSRPEFKAFFCGDEMEPLGRGGFGLHHGKVQPVGPLLGKALRVFAVWPKQENGDGFAWGWVFLGILHGGGFRSKRERHGASGGLSGPPEHAAPCRLAPL